LAKLAVYKGNIRLIIILVLICVTFNVFAAGQKEDKLAQAKQLYSEKYYDKALILLADIVREDPDRRDAAIEISNKTMKIREEYNTLYEKLIDTLYNKLDVDTALAIIEDMKSLDPYPNEKTKVTVEIAEDAASVVANKNFFESIMEQALAQVRENNYFGSAPERV
jgi:tetratricopeptide (TPR) repeat protein